MIMDKKLCAASVALAVFALAMVVPQGTALAKGMDVKTADLCLVNDELNDELDESPYGIGTVAPVTDNRTAISAVAWTAWAVSLEGMLVNGHYGVYNDVPPSPSESPEPCGGLPVYLIPTPDGTGFLNLASDVNPEVGDTVWICRASEGVRFALNTSAEELIPVLKGVLVKGGKQKNKPGRCPE